MRRPCDSVHLPGGRLGLSVRPSLRPTGPRTKLNPKSDGINESSRVRALDQKLNTSLARDLSLPEDVLSQVFAYVCQPDLDPISNPRWRREFYPLWLGKISRAWRECAWATSELWTTVIIRISTGHLELQADMLREWLERAKGRPLDVYIESSTDQPPFTWYADIRPLLTILTKHSEQWQRFDLYIPYRLEFFFRTIATPGLALPLLRHASIRHGENELLGKFEINLKEAPLLQALSLSNFTFNNPDFLLLYPTSKITRLFLSSSIQIDLNDLLSRFPELRELIWSKCQCFNQLPTTHNSLEILNVDFGIESSPWTFFYGLSLPTLKSLSLRISKPFQYPSRLEYISPCFQNGCSLTQLKLEFQMTASTEKGLLDLLSYEPISSSLTKLHIHDSNFKMGKMHVPERDTLWGVSQNFFDHLNPAAFPNFLPNLELLEYEGRLLVQSTDFMWPIILRSGVHVGGGAGSTSGMAALTKVTIAADQHHAISEHPDLLHVWEIIRMIEVGMLSLVNMDNTPWM